MPRRKRGFKGRREVTKVAADGAEEFDG